MKKPSYKNCENGHFYPASHDHCPFCKPGKTEKISSSGNNSGDNGDKTLIIGNDDKTIQTNTGSGDKTVVSGHGGHQEPTGDRTIVIPSGGGKESEDGEKEVRNFSRKLVGWLVSYTLNENGVDFRLYEGKNEIGRSAACSIRIVEDNALSSKHATILYRGGGLYFRDEMSTNPSFVNGEEVMPGNTVKLNDNDKIQVGDTIFTLRLSMI